MAGFQLVWQLAVVCAVLFWAGQAQGQLPANNAAVEAAIRNPRYMRRQINCLLNESPCDNIGRTMRRKYPTSIRVSVLKKKGAISNLVYFLNRTCTSAHQGPMSWMFSTTAPTGHESNERGLSAVSRRVQQDLLHLQPAGINKLLLKKLIYNCRTQDCSSSFPIYQKQKVQQSWDL